MQRRPLEQTAAVGWVVCESHGLSTAVRNESGRGCGLPHAPLPELQKKADLCFLKTSDKKALLAFVGNFSPE